MKQKFYIGLIIFLLLSVGIIQYLILKSDKSKDSLVIIKSAQIDKKDLKSPKISIDEIKFPPTKKASYIKPTIYAKNYILIDMESAYPLYVKNADIQVPIASTTKIMTAIIVLENYNLDDIITISQSAATQIGSDIYLRTNEKMTIENLLYALLVRSGNDAAMALAEKIGLDEFVKKMNEKAQYLGLNNTHFKDPAGLDDSGHSTAKDLAILAAYALRNKQFKKYIKTAEITITSTDGQITHKLESSNRLIKPDESLFYSEGIGIKTGFTPDAGHCLVAAAQRNNHTLISIILYTYENTKQASAKESKKLLQWGFNNYKWE